MGSGYCLPGVILGCSFTGCSRKAGAECIDKDAPECLQCTQRTCTMRKDDEIMVRHAAARCRNEASLCTEDAVRGRTTGSWRLAADC